MRGLEIFIIPNCPYCVKAKKAVTELKEETPDYQRVPVRWINEQEEVDYSNEHDYFYVPSIYFGNRKTFEAHPGDSYEKIRDAVRLAMDKAVFEGPELQC